MEKIPHIDITGNERIQEILDDPENYVFEAFDCEDVNEWVPDIGNTEYPNRSIYRPPVLAESGLLTTLRHRFWDTFRGTVDHTGERYVGVVLYDAAGEECPLEFRLGADDIGRVEPMRHDNRRHLIVVDRPVQFEGLSEVFQVTAPGKGTYRIETFVLLARRPEPGSFVPRIDRLSTRLTDRTSRGVTAEIHFITSQTACCVVEVRPTNDRKDGDTQTVRTDSLEKLHVIEVPNLTPDRHYTVEVTAIEKEDASARETIELFTGERRKLEQSQEVTAPVEIINITESQMAGPLTFGVPLPQGQLYRVGSATVNSNSHSTSAQTRIHSRWPDGSARWVLVDAPPPEPVAPSAAANVHVTLSLEAAPERQGLSWEESEAEVTVTGPDLRVSVARSRPVLPALIERRSGSEWRRAIGSPLNAGDDETNAAPICVTLGTGVTLRPGPIEDLALEETGAERCVIRYRVPHQDSGGVTHLRSTVRVHVYAREPAIKLVHRLEVVSPAMPPAARGTIDDFSPGFEEIRAAIAGTSGEEATLLTLKSVDLRLSRAGNSAVRFDGASCSLSDGNQWRLVHEHDQAFRLETNGSVREVDGRTRGNVVVDGESGALAVAVRNFWETYPKGVRVDQNAVSVELLPSLSGEDLPGDENAWHRLYFWHDKGKYRVKVGMALTSEIMIAFPESTEAANSLFDWFEQPPLVRPDLEWLNETGAWSPLAPKSGSPLAKYEQMVDDVYDEWMKDREYWRQYGFVNFGDFYGESSWAWGNNEYDPAFAHYCEYLRGGNPRWAVLAAQAARHMVDVDTVNYSKNPAHIGGQYCHIAGHAGGFLPPYFRYKVAGSTLIASHMWVEGIVLHYLLTGDENLRETVDRTAGWLLHGGMSDSGGGLNHYDFRTCRECGWHLIHLSGLARLTDNPRYLNAAYIIIDRVQERQDVGGGWIRMLKEGHCGCPAPRCRGEAGFMVGILLSGLRRVHELTSDERIAQIIEGGVRWLVSDTYDQGQKHFRYTPCPNLGEHSHGPVFTRQVIEGLSYAYKLTEDAVVGEIIKDSLEDLGEPRKASRGPKARSIGNNLCQETRSVPALLANIQFLFQ